MIYFPRFDRHAPAKIGIEQNSLNQWLSQPIRMEMLKRGVLLPLQLLQAPQDRSKEDFIMGLQPFANAKDIVLVGGRSAHPQLVAEWSNFPSGPRDVLNALAYALRMFGGVPVYEDFSAANIGDSPQTRRGEDVFVGFNANPSEAVAIAVLRDGRRLCVAGDWSASGALADAVKTLVFEVRSSFPECNIQAWVPADTYRPMAARGARSGASSGAFGAVPRRACCGRAWLPLGADALDLAQPAPARRRS